MRYYPAFLDLGERQCLVIGEGPLADEKAALLERAGAQVVRSRDLDLQQAKNCFLIVAAVKDAELARRVKEFGERNRIFVNVVDRIEHCTFIAPAIVDRGNLLIAISTSGKSPALASRIRGQLEEQFGHEYSDLLEALSKIRPRVRERFPSFEQRKAFYLHLIQMDLLETLRSEGLEGLRGKIDKELRAEDQEQDDENESLIFADR
jgi:precorrin-2 dehydrogenase / sirohydrochlorin ferrochelatase